MKLQIAKGIIKNINSPKILDADKIEAIDTIIERGWCDNHFTKKDLWEVIKWLCEDD